MPDLRGDEATLFERLDPALQQLLRARLRASEAQREDARSFAWEQLVRHQPKRTDRLLGWLYVVAKRELYEIQRRTRRECLRDMSPSSLEARPEDSGFGVRGGAAREPIEGALDVHEALAALAALPVKNREALGLRIGGYSYAELQERLGVTYTCVDRRLKEGRAMLRERR
jgi:RNA polymerase sigma factor (sigma-70 family)